MRGHRARNIAVVAIAAVLVLAAGAFAIVKARSDEKPHDKQRAANVATGPVGDAHALAQQMLDTLPLPAGARTQTPTPTTPSPGPVGPSTQVKRNAQWFVPESKTTTVDFIKKHRPAPLLGFGGGTGDGNSLLVDWMLKSLPSDIADAQMDVVVRDAPGGSTMNATSTVAWYPVRPASEAIPARDKVAIIDQYPKDQHKIVTDSAEVAKLIAAFNASHLLLDGPHSCPPIVDPNALLYTVRFAPAPTAPADVVVKRPAHNCGAAEVSVNGQPQPNIPPDRLDQAVGAALPR